MAHDFSVRALRFWLTISAVCFLLSGSGFVYCCFDGSASGSNLLSLGCACLTSGINVLIFYRLLRRKRTGDRRDC